MLIVRVAIIRYLCMYVYLIDSSPDDRTMKNHLKTSLLDSVLVTLLLLQVQSITDPVNKIVHCLPELSPDLLP